MGSNDIGGERVEIGGEGVSVLAVGILGIAGIIEE